MYLEISFESEEDVEKRKTVDLHPKFSAKWAMVFREKRLILYSHHGRKVKWIPSACWTYQRWKSKKNLHGLSHFFCKIFFLKITAREKISSSFLPKQNLNENFKHYDCPKIAKMLPLGTYFVPFFRSPKIHPNPKEETKATNIGSYAD